MYNKKVSAYPVETFLFVLDKKKIKTVVSICLGGLYERFATIKDKKATPSGVAFANV